MKIVGLAQVILELNRLLDLCQFRATAMKLLVQISPSLISNGLRPILVFRQNVFFPWFLSEEKEIGGKSFPDPTSAVRLAVSSQKVDVACEKYPAPILPLCITNHTFLSGTENVEGYFYFQSSFTQKLDDVGKIKTLQEGNTSEIKVRLLRKKTI